MTNTFSDTPVDLFPQEPLMPSDGSLGLLVDAAAPADDDDGPKTEEMSGSPNPPPAPVTPGIQAEPTLQIAPDGTPRLVTE